ncbi:NADP-dependent oxidoreductase [Nocardia sp. NPDC052566]|uniref:NADP-dependent oxidoreductase n=1 Tax=Nocardia sp. NPDC052566 TaxID=3364330 RepID=UPI0037CBA296
MSQTMNRCYRLRRRPSVAITPAELEFAEESIPDIGSGQALIRTLWLSIDPSNRIGMSEIHYGMPPVALGAVMRGFGIGEVVESRRGDMQPGDLVSGLTGWADYAVADATNLVPFTVLPTPLPGPMASMLGALGHTGVTAYLGVHDICRPRPGDTMVVTAAAGAVGSVAGQIGKARGARVIGTAGTPEKCDHVVRAFGFDACINYRDPKWRDQLDAATPDGIDIIFENVGGRLFEHLLTRINVGARIALCGLMADYHGYGSPGPAEQTGIDANRLLLSRAMLESFLVLDHSDRFPEARTYLAELIAAGELHHEQTVIDGLEHARDALNQMFAGANIGKLLIKVAERSRMTPIYGMSQGHSTALGGGV